MVDIVENKALRFRVRDPSKFAVIPRHHVTPIAGGYEVLTYWGLDETRVLRNMGFKVPSPIERNYDWPGRFTPMEHQKVTAGFLTLNRRGFVFNDPGVGKTVSALWAADYLMKRGEIRRILIVCPMSIMYTAWMADITNTIMHRSAIVAHHADGKKRVQMVKEGYEIVIVNYDGLPMIEQAIKADGTFDLIIVDEANGYSNPSTKRWKTLNKLLTPNTYLWMMTGTPAAQSPVHAYGLAKLVNPKNVPLYANQWKEKVMTKISTFKWVPKPNARDIVFEALQPAIRFTKEQCLDLPPVVKVTREVALSAQQKKFYDKIKQEMLLVAAGQTISAVNKAALMTKLLQISAGAVYTEDGSIVEFDASPRMNLLLEILEETDRKVLVFANYTSSIDTLRDYLVNNGVATEVIDGRVSANKRRAIIDAFQDSDTPRVLVMQPQATAHGITLTAADTIVFYGPVTSVELYTQCLARADRKGQNATKVTVHHIQSSPVEAKLFKAMEGKVNDHDLLTAMFNEEVKNNL